MHDSVGSIMRVGLSVVATAYVTVLLAELVGDRSVLMAGSLATRYRRAAVLAGLAAAFALKMLAAVLLGRVVSTLPPALVAAAGAAGFIGAAITLWRGREEPDVAITPREGALRVAVIAFGAVILAEWADVGQLTAAALTARYQAPVLVWLGATAAMVSKGAVGVALGGTLRRHVNVRLVRGIAAAWCAVLGVITASAIFGR